MAGASWLCRFRASLRRAAAVPLSPGVRQAAGLSGASLAPADFEVLLGLHAAALPLSGESGHFQVIRAYYGAVRVLTALLPFLATWSEREMARCAACIAVKLDELLARNLACAADLSHCRLVAGPQREHPWRRTRWTPAGRPQ